MKDRILDWIERLLDAAAEAADRVRGGLEPIPAPVPVRQPPRR